MLCKGILNNPIKLPDSAVLFIVYQSCMGTIIDSCVILYYVFTKLSMHLLYHRLTCTEGCDPLNVNTGAKIEMTCKKKTCYNVAWYIEDFRDNWEGAVSLTD